MILKAARHVQIAKEMQEFANKKIQESIKCHSKTLDEIQKQMLHSWKDTIICNFCQNMGLPQLGEHQAGATYYYLPLTVNCFGIADMYKKDATLTAYIYHEGEGKKGGNNVASLILKHLIDKGWTGNRHNKYAEELNIIMDNCAGQNKN
jgi:hypothetical protein